MALHETRAPRRLAVLATTLATAALVFTSIGVAAQDNTTTMRSNAFDPVPQAALAAMIGYCEEQTGIDVYVNTLNHEDYQNSFSQALQARPEDILMWFASARMRFFSDQGLFGPITDVWEGIDNISEGFKVANTGNDGEQYGVPFNTYPWVVIYRKSVFEENGWTVPTTIDEFKAIGDDALAKGLVPLAFGDLQGWPAMGTFDIINMRLNGYDFHIGLMTGEEKWTDPRVKAVFEAWRDLVPYLQPGGTGREWQEAAQALFKKEAAMYFLGTFAGEQIGASIGADATPEEVAAIVDDTDFFAFPVFGTEFDAEMGIDAPIDNLVMSAEPGNAENAKAILACVATGPAQTIFALANPNLVAVATDADTSGYSAFQNKMSEIIGASGAIGQFLDRDTRPDFAGPQGMQGFLINFIDDPDQDLDAYLQSIQDFWDTLPPLF
jgi:multiple sugar transport system substrate-binding protein